MKNTEIRRRRIAAGIPGTALCAKLGLQRSRLSDIENGYVQPSTDEWRRIEGALDELIKAKQAVLDVATEVGWPMH